MGRPLLEHLITEVLFKSVVDFACQQRQETTTATGCSFIQHLFMVARHLPRRHLGTIPKSLVEKAFKAPAVFASIVLSLVTGLVCEMASLLMA